MGLAGLRAVVGKEVWGRVPFPSGRLETQALLRTWPAEGQQRGKELGSIPGVKTAATLRCHLAR